MNKELEKIKLSLNELKCFSGALSPIKFKECDKLNKQYNSKIDKLNSKIGKLNKVSIHYNELNSDNYIK